MGRLVLCHLCGKVAGRDPCPQCVPNFEALCDAIPFEECEANEQQCVGCPAYDGPAPRSPSSGTGDAE